MESVTATGAPARSALGLQPFRGARLPLRDVGFTRRAEAGRVAGRHPEILALPGPPSLYVHEWTSPGFTVRAVVGALDLARPGARILAHEAVDRAQVDHLRRWMERLDVQPAPLLLVHRGGGELSALLDRVSADATLVDFTDRRGQRHRIWRLDDPDDETHLCGAVANADLLIADGHHRHAAYQEMRASRPGGPSELGLVGIIDHDDTPLHIGAIHRVLAGVELETLVDAARGLGLEVDLLGAGDPLAHLSPGRLVLTDGTRTALVTARALPVVDLDSLIAVQPAPPHVAYWHAAPSALGSRRRHGGTAALLPALTVDEVLQTVSRGTLLPAKATSFQPKPTIGLMMRSLAPPR
ncbi:DUF1015 family protein [Nocardioides acrostichi]|uniref:DUF1015 family protein n=1 Tax=Nocardioides acrostichi TaxID=2784339 RepID=A0A930V355_9ACTN|nr:DUF1015 family protein [Nocardioides acrostichi]MBF4163825.1 DUF1015 family protein [Nocardioides acrostichi]